MTFTSNNTKTEIVVSNHTVTTTLPPVVSPSTNSDGVEVMQCALTDYDLVGGNTTVSSSPYDSYNTTTTLSQNIGFVTTTTKDSDIVNGTVGDWIDTACTVVASSKNNSSVSSVGLEVMDCTVNVYSVVSVETLDNYTITTSSTGGTSTMTFTYVYNTTTPLSRPVGYATTATYNPATNSSTTVSGVIAEWTVTACTVISTTG